MRGDRDRALQSYMKAKELFTKKELPQAKDHFLQAIEHDDSLHNARLMLAKVHYYEKTSTRPLRKWSAYSKRMTITSGPSTGRPAYGFVRPSEKSSDTEAMTLLTRVLELDAHHLPARSLLALLYKRTGNTARRSTNTWSSSRRRSPSSTRAPTWVCSTAAWTQGKDLAEIDRAISISRAGGHSDARLRALKKEVAE